VAATHILANVQPIIGFRIKLHADLLAGASRELRWRDPSRGELWSERNQSRCPTTEKSQPSSVQTGVTDTACARLDVPCVVFEGTRRSFGLTLRLKPAKIGTCIIAALRPGRPHGGAEGIRTLDVLDTNDPLWFAKAVLTVLRTCSSRGWFRRRWKVAADSTAD